MMMQRRTFLAMTAAAGTTLVAPARSLAQAETTPATPMAGAAPETGYAPVNGHAPQSHDRATPLVTFTADGWSAERS